MALQRAAWRQSDSVCQSLFLNPNDWRALQKLNAIKTPNKLQIGQIVRVPLVMVKQAAAPAEVVLLSCQAGILNADKVM